MKYRHSEEYVIKIINNANLTPRDVMSWFEQKGIAQHAINFLRECDADTIRWFLRLVKNAE